VRKGLGGLRPSPCPFVKCNSSPINGQCTNFLFYSILF